MARDSLDYDHSLLEEDAALEDVREELERFPLADFRERADIFENLAGHFRQNGMGEELASRAEGISERFRVLHGSVDDVDSSAVVDDADDMIADFRRSMSGATG